MAMSSVGCGPYRVVDPYSEILLPQGSAPYPLSNSSQRLSDMHPLALYVGPTSRQDTPLIGQC